MLRFILDILWRGKTVIVGAEVVGVRVVMLARIDYVLARRVEPLPLLEIDLVRALKSLEGREL